MINPVGVTFYSVGRKAYEWNYYKIDKSPERATLYILVA